MHGRTEKGETGSVGPRGNNVRIPVPVQIADRKDDIEFTVASGPTPFAGDLAVIHRQSANSGPSGSSDAKPKLARRKLRTKSMRYWALAPAHPVFHESDLPGQTQRTVNDQVPKTTRHLKRRRMHCPVPLGAIDRPASACPNHKADSTRGFHAQTPAEAGFVGPYDGVSKPVGLTGVHGAGRGP
jgi:hypothetical protein